MFKKKCEKMFEAAGITVNGKDPWDMQVHSDRVFSKAILNGNLGLGETYLGGDWDCDRLDDFFYLLIKGGLDRRPYPVSVSSCHYTYRRHRGRRARCCASFPEWR